MGPPQIGVQTDCIKTSAQTLLHICFGHLSTSQWPLLHGLLPTCINSPCTIVMPPLLTTLSITDRAAHHVSMMNGPFCTGSTHSKPPLPLWASFINTHTHASSLNFSHPSSVCCPLPSFSPFLTSQAPFLPVRHISCPFTHWILIVWL